MPVVSFEGRRVSPGCRETAVLYARVTVGVVDSYRYKPAAAGTSQGLLPCRCRIGPATALERVAPGAAFGDIGGTLFTDQVCAVQGLPAMRAQRSESGRLAAAAVG